MPTLGKFAYYARVLYEMKRKKAVTSYMPEYVAIEITNVCNFKCAFCPQSDPDHHQIVPRSYLEGEQCELFLHKIRSAGVETNLIHWTLDGEPFMNPKFAELCKVGVKYGFTNSHFATNGMLCSPERLAEFPVDECRFNLAIDFCADRDYFEEVRGTKNSWERVKNNIDAILRDEKFAKVFIEITDISSFSIADEKQLEENFKALEGTFVQNGRIRFRTRTFHNATGFLDKLVTPQGTKYHLCPYPWSTLRVASNGDVVACCRDLRHKTVLGNLLRQELPQIWNGEAMQELRRNLIDEQPELSAACKGCDLPYDNAKFSVGNLLEAAIGRMQLFNR